MVVRVFFFPSLSFTFLLFVCSSPSSGITSGGSYSEMRLISSRRSKAKIQRHFRFSPPLTFQEFEKKTCETFVGKCYKSSPVRGNYKLGVSRMSISKFPGRLPSIKLNFSATVLTLCLMLNKSFGGNCARAPRLTAVCLLLQLRTQEIRFLDQRLGNGRPLTVPIKYRTSG